MVCCCHLELNLALIIFSDRFSHSSRHTCIRSSGLPIGSHGIVGWRAQKSGHRLRHIGLHRVAWLQVSVVKSFLLSRIASAEIKKNQIKGILKVSYRFITSWQLHDLRLQSVVDLRCHEYDFCLFDTQTHFVFLLFLCRYFVHGIRPPRLCCPRVS